MNSLAPSFSPSTDLSTSLFPPSSRYHGLGVQRVTLGEGKEVSYVSRRILPQVDRFETLQEHLVAEGDRPDNLAAQYMGDPELFWRLADANSDLNPFELTARVNRRLRITLPEGIPGVPTIG